MQVSSDERVHTSRASSTVVLITPAGLKIDLLVLKVLCILLQLVYLVAYSKVCNNAFSVAKM